MSDPGKKPRWNPFRPSPRGHAGRNGGPGRSQAGGSAQGVRPSTKPRSFPKLRRGKGK